MDYRQYDMAIGRFNSIDELAEEAYDITPYRFAYNNPVYWNDPSGLKEESGNEITGWVNKGGKTFWDPNVNNAGDVKKLYGDTAKYVADDTVTPNGDGTSTQYNADGTKSTILKEVVISIPKPSKIEKPRDLVSEQENQTTEESVLAGGIVLTASSSEVPPAAVGAAIVTTVAYSGIKLYRGVFTVFNYAANFKNNFAKTKPGKAAEVNGAEHTSGARASTANTHEVGQTRKQQVNRDKKRQDRNWKSNK